MPRCIYCKQVDVQFNREHVIPEAFGTFGADTMILEGQVCKPCNSTLGGRLDLVLARDSWESRLRSQMLAGQGGRHGHDRFLERRVEMRYEDEGHFPQCRSARFTQRNYRLISMGGWRNTQPAILASRPLVLWQDPHADVHG